MPPKPPHEADVRALLALAKRDPAEAFNALHRTREELLTVEAAIFRAALERSGWSVSAAAALLGFPKHSTLASKLTREPHLADLRAEYDQRRPAAGRKPAQ